MTPLKRLLMPPWLYVRGMVVIAFSFVRPMFICGKGYPHGKWFCLPVLIAVKLTLRSIVIAATALLLGVARPWNPQLEPAMAGGEPCIGSSFGSA
jgi:hypothetical protein